MLLVAKCALSKYLVLYSTFFVLFQQVNILIPKFSFQKQQKYNFFTLKKSLMVKLSTQFWSSVVRRNSLGYLFGLLPKERKQRKLLIISFVKPSIGNLLQLESLQPWWEPQKHLHGAIRSHHSLFPSSKGRVLSSQLH